MAQQTQMAHFVYILECQGNRYYTGYTTDLERRYQEHVEGSAKWKFTRSFAPIKIAACWDVADKSSALKIEKFIKSLSRKEKEALVADPEKAVILSFAKDLPKVAEDLN